MRRYPRYFALVTVLLLAAGRAAGDEPDDCFACHGDKVDARKFAASPHAAVGCTACHADVTGYPHPETIRRPDCASCHDDVVTGWQQGAHGPGHTPDRAPAAGCADCHGDVHAAVPHTEPGSPLHWSSLAATCARCHRASALADGFRIPVVRPVEAYLKSVHARAVAAGKHGATCADCHGAHDIAPPTEPQARLARPNVAATCSQCHAGVYAAYRDSVHGVALARGVRDAPVCTDCHGEHSILPHTDPASPVFAANIPNETCGRCHESIRLGEKYGLPEGQVAAFRDSYHGLALRAGQLTAANCASCHGIHDIQPSRDPRSHVHPANLATTCGKCHPGAGVNFALGPVHVLPATVSATIVSWVRFAYLWLIGVVVGAMAVHNALDLVRKARRPRPDLPAPRDDEPERMSRVLRWQHGLVMGSFTALVYTGFALTYPDAWWATPLLQWETELGLRGWLHRAAAVVLIGALAWHLVHLAASRPLRACLSELRWSRRDLTDVVAVIAHPLRPREITSHGQRFGYVEKAEYWAFLWGSVVMAATGFVLWFENASLRFLPKWVTDVATAIHFYEAILATAAIVVWHFYWVIFDPDVYPMDASWWHGRAPAARVLERSKPHDAAPAAKAEEEP